MVGMVGADDEEVMILCVCVSNRETDIELS